MFKQILYSFSTRLWISLVAILYAAMIAAQPRAPVEYIIVDERTISESLTLSGTVTAERDARLSVATSGLVSVIHVDAGSQVSEGDLLLELDAELARYQWQGARAARIRAERALGDAKRRLDEARALAPQQSIAETVVKNLEAEVLEDEAALGQARAEEQFREGLLKRHSLKAPFNGVISGRFTDPGEWVNPGTAVMQLVATQDLRIDLQLPEDYLERLGKTTQVRLQLGGDRSSSYSARVSAVVPVTDPTARTALVRVIATDQIGRMRPGMSARVELLLDTGRQGIVIPRDAVLRFSDGRAVAWVVNQTDGDATVSERRVEAGLSFNGNIEITSGLSAGERVVVRGNESLRSDQQVAATRFDGN